MRGKKDDASGPRIAIADNPTEPPRRPHHHGELPRQGAPPLARARTDNVKGSAVGEGEREEAQAARAAPVSLPISTSRAGRGEARRGETRRGLALVWTRWRRRRSSRGRGREMEVVGVRATVPLLSLPYACGICDIGISLGVFVSQLIRFF